MSINIKLTNQENTCHALEECKTVLVTTNEASCQIILMITKYVCLFLRMAPFAGVQRAHVSGSSLRLIPDGTLTCQTQQL